MAENNAYPRCGGTKQKMEIKMSASLILCLKQPHWKKPKQLKKKSPREAIEGKENVFIHS